MNARIKITDRTVYTSVLWPGPEIGPVRVGFFMAEPTAKKRENQIYLKKDALKRNANGQSKKCRPLVKSLLYYS